MRLGLNGDDTSSKWCLMEKGTLCRGPGVASVTAGTVLKSWGQSGLSQSQRCTSIHEKAPFRTAEENIHGEKRTKYRKLTSPTAVWAVSPWDGNSLCPDEAVSNCMRGKGLWGPFTDAGALLGTLRCDPLGQRSHRTRSAGLFHRKVGQGRLQGHLQALGVPPRPGTSEGETRTREATAHHVSGVLLQPLRQGGTP